MTEQTLRSAQQTIVDSIRFLYEEDEARAISADLLQDLLGVSRAGIQSGDQVLTAAQSDMLAQSIERLLQHEPLQYITGKAHFYGLEFKVNSHVLIPRPETEELVHLILQASSPSAPISILDIGTGSGCIPIALKKHLPSATVYALDVSAEALKVAEENARLNEADVQFIKGDILDPETGSGMTMSTLDMIVSNPPYITGNEKADMHANVLQHEPHLALFVPDEDPLLFYKAIARFANRHLKTGGTLYVEINAAYGEEVKNCMHMYGFADIVIVKDMQGKDRMVKGILVR